MNTDQSLHGYKELPNEVIKEARFPPTCPVVFDTKAAKNNASFDIKTGTVQKAYYNAKEENTLYGIKPNDNNESSQQELVFRKRKDLSFGYNCRVEVYNNGRKEEGNIISPGQCDVDRYDCMFPTKNGYEYRVVEKIHVDNIKYLPPSTSTPPTEVVVSGNSLTDNQEKEEEATTDQSLESDSNYSEEESEYDPNESASKEGNAKSGAAYMGSNTKGVYSQNGGKYTSSITLKCVLFHGGTTTLASDSAHRHDLLNDQLKIPNREKHFPHLKDYQAARAKEIQERGLSEDNVGCFESAKLQAKQSIEAEIAKKMAAKDTTVSKASPQSKVPNERRYIGSQPTRAEEIEKQPAFKPGEDCSFEWNVGSPVLNRRREGESLPSRDGPKRKREESGHSHPLQRKKAMSSDSKHTIANKSMIRR